MQISITGHHIEVTEPLRTYVNKKMDRILRHYDQMIDVHYVLSVEKLRHIAEATLRVPGSDIHANAEAADMYAAIDSLIDKLDRQVRKHKEKITDHHARDSDKRTYG